MRRYIAIILMQIIITSINAQTDTVFKALPLGLTTQLYSESLKEARRINIYLPNDYHAEDTVHYPVIYILDGGVQEDFLHLTGIVNIIPNPGYSYFPNR